MFVVSNTASLTGKDVGIFLSGFLSMISFTNDATIDLSGAESGEMDGLLFFDDPKASRT